MRILVVNCGGSSVKCRLVEMPEGRVLAKSAVERIGRADALVTFTTETSDRREAAEVPDHASALGRLLELLHATFGEGAVEAIAHRAVHGGSDITGSVLIDARVVEILRSYSALAPLHNPANLKGIEACERSYPNLPQVAVFDTAFHVTLPAPAYTYALPFDLCAEYRIRRYGFHGIAFRAMAEGAERLFGRKVTELRLVQLMLGSGTTANALRFGISVDVSTGLTPTEGLVQSTRCGDLDPLAVTYLMRRRGWSAEEMERVLCRESGWLGISGVSSDLREVEEAASQGHARAQLALDTLAYRTRKYIGAYAAAMGGLEAITIAGGAGEGSPTLRASLLSGLEFLGVELDPEKNEQRQGERVISSDESRVAVGVVSADEETTIAKEAWRLVSPSGR